MSLLIPVTAPIGQDPIERIFCGRAHDFVSDMVVPDECPEEKEGRCRFTGYKSLCLFADFDDPAWKLIRESQDI